jgi:hypothetical protein
MTKTSEERVKQSYSTPRLERYGNLRDLTHTTGFVGAKNDGGNGSTKTS